MLNLINPLDKVAAGRLVEFLSERTHWHRSLWGVGVILAMEELHEACAVMAQGHLSEGSVKRMISLLQKRVGVHPAFTDAEKNFLRQQAQHVPRADGAAHFGIRELSARVSGEQTGSRTLEKYLCTTSGTPPSGDMEASARGWEGDNVSFALTHPGGDVMNFSWYEQAWGGGGYIGPTLTVPPCERNMGYKITSWNFPNNQSFTLNTLGPAGRVTDWTGKYIDLTTYSARDSLGRMISSSATEIWTDLTGGQWKFELAPEVAVSDTARPIPFKRLIKQFEPVNTSQAALEYIYDSVGRVKEAKDAVAIQQPTERGSYKFYLAPGVRAEREDPAGGKYVVDYDTDGNAIKHTDEVGRATATAYDGRNRVLSRTWPELDQTLFEYDSRDNVTKMTQVAKPGSGLANLVIEAAWHTSWNKPLWIKDAKGFRTDFEYFETGNNGKSLIKKASRPAPTGPAPIGTGTRPEYTFTYNTFGQVLTQTDPTGLQTAHTYASVTAERLSTTTAYGTAAAATTTFFYTGPGDIAAQKDARGNAVAYQYDAMRRRTETRFHNGGAMQVNTANVLSPLMAADRTTYDLNGRAIKEEKGTSFAGASTVGSWQLIAERTYTPTGKVATETNGAGETTATAYDALDRPLIVTDPIGRRVASRYNLAGELLCEWKGWNSSTAPTTCDFDPSTYTGAGPSRYAEYTYSANGQRASVKDANNNLSTLEYDGFDRLSKLRFPVTTLGANQSSTTDYEQYGYDVNGNRTSFRKRDGQTIGFTFDNLNRETVKDIPGGTTNDVYTDYDLAGRPEFVHLGGAASTGVDYVYDVAKRLSAEISFSRSVSFQYDVNNNRTRLTWPDSNYVVYDYDAMNRVTKVRENNASSGVGVLATYAYDPLSRRTGITRGNSANSTFTYDWASRLLSLKHDPASTTYDVTFGFGYTGAGQLSSRSFANTQYKWTSPTVNRTYVADGLNRYSSVAGVNFSYDANGNLTGDGSRTMAYDVENRLASITGGGANLTLTYDPLGRLRQTTAGSAVTQFLYDDDRLVAEYSGSGTLLRRYAHGLGVDEPIVWYEGSGLTTRNFLHADERGTIVATSSNTGAGTAYNYETWGEPNIWTGSRFKYTGQIALSEGGANLYHYKARVYDPRLGRFLQTDPVGYEDDVNMYGYVKNDPMNNVDPDGRMFMAWNEAKGNLPRGSAEQMARGQVAGLGVAAAGAALTVGAAAAPEVAAAARASPLMQQAAGMATKYADKIGTALTSAKVSVDLKVSQAATAAGDKISKAAAAVQSAVGKAVDKIANAAQNLSTNVLSRPEPYIDFVESLNPGTPTVPSVAGFVGNQVGGHIEEATRVDP